MVRPQFEFELYEVYFVGERLGPYHADRTLSRPIWEVKQRQAWLVLAWVTGWEYRVLKPLFLHSFAFENFQRQS